MSRFGGRKIELPKTAASRNREAARGARPDGERRRVAQYDQIRITDSNELPKTTIVGIGSKR
jgi:hypothetical protein